MKVYPYRTTYDKMTAHVARIEAEGDSVVQFVFVGGRDWVLLVREGGPGAIRVDRGITGWNSGGESA